jgi:hypothetical protein
LTNQRTDPPYPKSTLDATEAEHVREDSQWLRVLFKTTNAHEGDELELLLQRIV